jgi:predicted ATP-dependent serine protease
MKGAPPETLDRLVLVRLRGRLAGRQEAIVTGVREGQAAFGIRGLDDVLGGGLERRRFFLLEGSPGTGKTTTSTQFLIAGRSSG